MEASRSSAKHASSAHQLRHSPLVHGSAQLWARMCCQHRPRRHCICTLPSKGHSETRAKATATASASAYDDHRVDHLWPGAEPLPWSHAETIFATVFVELSWCTPAQSSALASADVLHWEAHPREAPACRLHLRARSDVQLGSPPAVTEPCFGGLGSSSRLWRTIAALRSASDI